MKHFITLVLCLTAMAAFVACSKSTPGSGSGQKSDGHDHDHADHDHDHDHADHDHDEHGAAMELGSATIADWTVRASRSEGEIKPGGDAPIDVWLTGGTGKVNAVRFWIGSEDGAGSVKAKAETEGEPNHWHAHAEAPNPIPAGSRLWVELEIEGQGKKTGSFDLKM